MRLPYNDRLAKAGIASYTFDFISGNYGSRSDGNAEEMSVHLYGSFTDYEGPVYIFHGGLDNWAPISYSQKAVREYKNAQLFTFPSEDHGFSEKSNREVAVKMIEVILSVRE
jgi:pimeloyl-ACP methyl ester carboxylesterase